LANICIIPARGGSKRIPRKNIKDFLGKPILAYSIETALKSQLFDSVLVSTDDEEIASIAKKYGASVPFLRSAKNSGDTATTFDVLKEVLEHFAVVEYGCCIYPCAPFVSSELLQKAFQQLKNDQLDCVFPMIAYGHPIQRAYLQENNFIRPMHPENALKRSQDLPVTYHDAGQFYFFKSQAILSKKKLITDKTGGLEISEMDAQDIDNEIDWELAEMKYKLKQKRGL